MAQCSATAAKETKQLFSQSASEVAEGVELVSAMQAAIQERGATMYDVDRFTQQNAANSEETTATCHSMAQQAEELAREPSRFEIAGQAKPGKTSYEAA